MITHLQIWVPVYDAPQNESFLIRSVVDMPFFPRKGDIIGILGDERKVLDSRYEMEPEEGKTFAPHAIVTLAEYFKPESDSWEDTQKYFTLKGFSFINLGYLYAPDCFYPGITEL